MSHGSSGLPSRPRYADAVACSPNGWISTLEPDLRQLFLYHWALRAPAQLGNEEVGLSAAQVSGRELLRADEISPGG